MVRRELKMKTKMKMKMRKVVVAGWWIRILGLVPLLRARRPSSRCRSARG
jgi:hypothetical protein